MWTWLAAGIASTGALGVIYGRNKRIEARDAVAPQIDDQPERWDPDAWSPVIDLADRPDAKVYELHPDRDPAA